jgi:hypothetical protein
LVRRVVVSIVPVCISVEKEIFPAEFNERCVVLGGNKLQAKSVEEVGIELRADEFIIFARLQNSRLHKEQLVILYFLLFLI